MNSARSNYVVRKLNLNVWQFKRYLILHSHQGYVLKFRTNPIIFTMANASQSLALASLSLTHVHYVR